MQNTYNKHKQLKETYINDISNIIQMCDDISLLDLIHRLLKKSIKH